VTELDEKPGSKRPLTAGRNTRFGIPPRGQATRQAAANSETSEAAKIRSPSEADDGGNLGECRAVLFSGEGPAIVGEGN